MVIDHGLIELRRKLQAIDSVHHTDTINFRKWGAGIVLVLVIGSLIFYRLTTDINPKNVQTVKDETAKPTVKRKDAAKQNENPGPPAEKVPNTSSPTIKRDTTTLLLPAIAERPEDVPTEIPINLVDTIKQVEIPERPVPVSPPIKEIIPCELSASKIEVSTTESCANSPTGKIVIGKNSDLQGKAPFTFSINAKNYTNEYVFAGLYPGSYQLMVRDAAGCSWEYDKDIHIDEKDCHDQEYSFYPGKGEVWRIPVGQNSNGRIEVYNRNGALVFSTSINNGYPDTWDGTSSGQPLSMGSYSFILKLEDKVLTGSVTIVR
jgi:hypothetical protein